MKLTILFLISGFRIFRAFASPTSKLHLLADEAVALASIEDENSKGYECGHTFFSDSEVNEVFMEGLKYAGRNFHHPQKYTGKLYSDSGTTEYLLWPIRKGSLIKPQTKNTKTPYRIVFTKNSEKVIDLVSRITTNDFTKCVRRDGSQIESSLAISEETNGYQCGDMFFTDETVQESLDSARKMIGKKSRYPAPYSGHLYPENSGYVIWPILARKQFFQTGEGETGPYYVVISKEGELIETIVRGYSSNFLRCVRFKHFPKVQKNDHYSKLFVPPPRTGYLCGKTFFTDEMLQVAANKAKNIANYRIRERFPDEYSGRPFYQPSLLWPIMHDGTLYRKGSVAPYRIVFNMDYTIRCLAIFISGEIKLCERKTITGKKHHETSDYLCMNQLFTHEQLVITVEAACERMKTAKFKTFPAKYRGPEFEKDGPYFTFPVFENGIFTSNIGRDRVVMNSNCEIVGALTTLIRDLKKIFVKCFKLDDGPLPKGFFFEQNEPISEYQIRY